MLLLVVSSVNATSIIIDRYRNDNSQPYWQPFVWEYSASLVLLILIIPLLWFDQKFSLNGPKLLRNIGLHFLFTIPYALAFTLGIIVIRSWVYRVYAADYEFGPFLIGFIYEYRKVLLAYLAFMFILYTYRFILSRLDGEATFVGKGELEADNIRQGSVTKRLLIKKFGKEFIVELDDVEWIESAGNYLNLHVGDRVYPLRQTMTRMQQTLAKNDFVRIHRSTIVRIDQIREIRSLDSGDQEVTLKGNKTLRMSRRYKDELKSVLE
ncbi:LytTR family DNA-binding domain-containing protein [Kangiella sp. TOML190]|uniref:LytR/AlgR family response regulator transcription factor n=1 Tax=Kangiella sp. TOML190 TaxID=2931351 RepID=UPI00203F3338|nr:LytTR family DNA-binding domain-containing protein [Kangiella sp. TOML190]